MMVDPDPKTAKIFEQYNQFEEFSQLAHAKNEEKNLVIKQLTIKENLLQTKFNKISDKNVELQKIIHELQENNKKTKEENRVLKERKEISENACTNFEKQIHVLKKDLSALINENSVHVKTISELKTKLDELTKSQQKASIKKRDGDDYKLCMKKNEDIEKKCLRTIEHETEKITNDCITILKQEHDRFFESLESLNAYYSKSLSDKSAEISSMRLQIAKDRGQIRFLEETIKDKLR